MTRIQMDLVVGGFVLTAAALLLWGTLQIEGNLGWGVGDAPTVVARFTNVAGLDEETDVLVAGVPVGKVSRIELEGRTARVTMRIDTDGIEIPSDSTVAIRSRGLLGDSVVEIVLGSSNRALASGGSLTRTESAANVDELIERFSGVARDFQQISATFRNVFGSAEGEEALSEVVANVRALTSDLRTVVQANAERMDRIVSNIESFSEDAASITEGTQEHVLQVAKNFEDASRQLNEALEGLARVSARIDRGEGTLGKLMSDDDLYRDLDAALQESQLALREIRRAAQETQEQIPSTLLMSVFGALW